MNETASTVPVTETQNRTTGALVLFLLFVLPMPACLLLYHFIVWTMEQSAIASLSLGNLAWSGLIGLAIQALLMTGNCAATAVQVTSTFGCSWINDAGQSLLIGPKQARRIIPECHERMNVMW